MCVCMFVCACAPFILIKEICVIPFLLGYVNIHLFMYNEFIYIYIYIYIYTWRPVDCLFNSGPCCCWFCSFGRSEGFYLAFLSNHLYIMILTLLFRKNSKNSFAFVGIEFSGLLDWRLEGLSSYIRRIWVP